MVEQFKVLKITHLTISSYASWSVKMKAQDFKSMLSSYAAKNLKM
jgi:hypothetical protein